MVNVLIVYYSLGGNTRFAAEAFAEGCREKGAKGVLKTGTEADEKDLLKCDGIAIRTPDYFSYMAGGLKDFFDRTFYSTQGRVEGKPYVGFITHGGGGKAITSVESICGFFKLKKVAEPVLVKNRPSKNDIIRLKELGYALVASIKK